MKHIEIMWEISLQMLNISMVAYSSEHHGEISQTSAGDHKEYWGLGIPTPLFLP